LEAKIGSKDYIKFLKFTKKLKEGAEDLGFFGFYEGNARVFGRGKIPTRHYLHIDTNYQKSAESTYPQVIVSCDDFQQEEVAKISFVSPSIRLFKECVAKIKDFTELEQLTLTSSVDVESM